MLEVRDLELVQAIVANGNFARAARVLGIGQPVLTRRLADLERRLGGPLFRRGHGGPEPTNLGRALLADAEDIVGRMRGLEQRLTEVRGRQDDELRIAAGGFAAETCALDAAAAMITSEPGVQVHFSTMNWMDALHAVRERHATIGVLEITAMDEDAGELLFEPLLRHPGFFVARAGHPLVGRTGITLADILAFPLVFLGKLPTRVLAPLAAAREAARAKGPVHAAFPAVVHESPTAAIRVVNASDAVIAVTAPIAASAIRSGELVTLPWRAPWMTTNFGIVQIRGRRITPAGSRYLDFLREADRKAFDIGQAMLARMAEEHGLQPDGMGGQSGGAGPA